MANPPYAHTPNAQSIWHELSVHALAVNEMAQKFAAPFGLSENARLVALVHDAGKAHPDFQAYLEEIHSGNPTPKKCPHAIWGSALFYEILSGRAVWQEIALPILGHHAGLHSAAEAEQKLCHHLNKSRDLPEHKVIKKHAFALLGSELKVPQQTSNPLERELSIRMLFSCLVDADFLDTEAHFSPGKSPFRGHSTLLSDLWPIFRRDQISLMWKKRGSTISRFRAKAYFETLQAAKNRPGVFRLTVPTGGGKTRTSVAFALRHALHNPEHGFQRIIIALPFTSIVDQTASEYRKIFGPDCVLEHQSQSNDGKDSEHDPEAKRRAMACENWDFPIIVTTTIQLFESLFSNRPSRCRKLHNIAKSILILDEAQTLPTEFLRPTLNVIKLLQEKYGVTVVFCTATQPTIEKSPYLAEWAGASITELVPSFPLLFSNLDRVTYEGPRNFDETELVDALASKECSSVLAIFNTRKDALRIYEHLLGDNLEGLYHLSTLLCSHHRRAVLDEIKNRLNDGKPVRLISTQVVEAGVDLDFPVVFRALGPLDRIVQAAGRCNREFSLGQKGGRVVLFQLTGGRTPQGAYARGLDIANQLLSQPGAVNRLSSPEIFEDYFVRLYRDVDLDLQSIDEYRRDLDYPNVAAKYRFIEETEQFVVAGYDYHVIDPLIKAHRFAPSRSSWRALQPYAVSLMKWEADMLKAGNADEISPGLWRWNGPYDRKNHRGLQAAKYDPADLILSTP